MNSQFAVTLILFIIEACFIFRISASMNFPNLWRLAEQHSKIDSQLQKLPVDVNRNLVQALMKAGSHMTDVALREKFMTTVSIWFYVAGIQRFLS